MARILAISSHVAYGPVGNAAAVPALQARGHEVLAVPTVILSNHPGHGAPAGMRTAPADLAAILERATAFASIDAVMTGYFASPQQIAEAAAIIHKLRQKNPGLYVLVDPVMGDGGKLYVPVEVAEAIRNHLLPLATCLTPNRFELEWLTGARAGTLAEAITAARALNLPEVLATSIPAPGGQLASIIVAAEAAGQELRPLRPHVPHGTGDFLAGCYLAARLDHSPETALNRAQQLLDRAIQLSEGTSVLDVARALH